MKQAMINSLKDLLAINSVEDTATDIYPFGAGVAKALDYILALGKSMGFRTKNCDYYAGYIEFGEGEDMVGILCHLDVVPAGDGWTYPPFSGTEADGKLYGRGAFDDKGPAIAALYAMNALKNDGVMPGKRIRLILGCNEESGSKGIAYYLENEEVPDVSFTPDAEFPVIHGEMGIIILTLSKTFNDRLEDGGIHLAKLTGGNAFNMVPDHAEALLSNHDVIPEILKGYNATKKTSLTLSDKSSSGEALSDGYVRIVAAGISAHGSMPEKGKNAISDLVDFLDYLDLEIGDSTNFIRFIKHHIGHDLHGERFGIQFEDLYNPLVLNLGIVSLDETSGEVKINIRYPITMSGEDVRTGIEKVLDGSEIKISGWKDMPPLFYEPDHPLVETLMRVYRAMTNDLDAKPITIGGGTYARSMPNAIAFGALFKDSTDNMHQKDEFIKLDELFKLTDIFKRAIEALCELDLKRL